MQLPRCLATAVLAATFLLPIFRPAHAGDISETANERFLAANAARSGVTVRPSGLQYRIIKRGAGRSPTANDVVALAYRGQLIDGTVFDQASKTQPLVFPVGRFISGWREALPLMREGDEWQLVVPSNLGYADRAQGDVIPANQTLIFDMELLAVK